MISEEVIKSLVNDELSAWSPDLYIYIYNAKFAERKNDPFWNKSASELKKKKKKKATEKGIHVKWDLFNFSTKAVMHLRSTFNFTNTN